MTKAEREAARARMVAEAQEAVRANPELLKQRRANAYGPGAVGLSLFGAGAAAVKAHELVALGWIFIVLGMLLLLMAVIGWLIGDRSASSASSN